MAASFCNLILATMQLFKHRYKPTYRYSSFGISGVQYGIPWQCCGSGSESGSGFICQKYGSGSFYNQAKIVRKTSLTIVLWLLYVFLSLENDVNVLVPWKSNQQKNFIKIKYTIFCCRHKCHWRNYGSATLFLENLWSFKNSTSGLPEGCLPVFLRKTAEVSQSSPRGPECQASRACPAPKVRF